MATHQTVLDNLPRTALQAVVNNVSGYSVSEILDLVAESRVSNVQTGGWTKGGYSMTAVGYERWYNDVLYLLDYVASTDYGRYNDFLNHYKTIDPQGYDVLVGRFYHEEEQQVADVEAMVPDPPAAPIVDLPPTTTQPPPPTTVPPPTTTIPPRSYPPWPRPPGRWIEIPQWETPTRPPGVVEWEGAHWGRPSHEHEAIHANIGQGLERLIGAPGAELPHTRSIGGGLRVPSRNDWSRAGWDPVIEGVGTAIRAAGTGLRAIGDFMGRLR